MSTISEALLALEPTPPDEVVPRRRNPRPVVQVLSVTCGHVEGDKFWSVYAAAELEGLGRQELRTRAATAREAWDEAFQFLERLVGGAP